MRKIINIAQLVASLFLFFVSVFFSVRSLANADAFMIVLFGAIIVCTGILVGACFNELKKEE